MLLAKLFGKKEKTTYQPMDTTFLVIVIILVTTGLIMMFSASYANAYYLKGGNSTFYISRQIIWAFVGLIAMGVASMVDHRVYRRASIILYPITIALLAATLFMPALNGAKRWIFIGPFNFQPSEIAKFEIVILFALMICKNFQKMRTLRYGVLPFAAAMLPILIIMKFEPHLSGIILIFLIGATMMFIGGTHPIWYILGGSVFAAAGVAVIANPNLLTVFAEYAGSRIEIWLDPTIDPQGKGFQTLQSLYAIASGGLMGTGIGGSRQKYLYLPEPYNDFIFAIICEELGFVGATLIICLFALLIWRGFVIAVRCPDRFGSLVAAGLTTQVGLQVLLNIAVVTKTVPNTGISLPFFSYGGTSLAMLMGEMGIILSISKIASIEKK